MVVLSETARMAIAGLSEPVKELVNDAITGLQSGEPPAPAMRLATSGARHLWVVRVNERLRVVFSRDDDRILVVDVLDKASAPSQREQDWAAR